MSDLASLQPGRDDRMIVLGQTGMGKTVLVEHLLRQRPYVLALDTKGDLNWGAPFTLVKSFDRLKKLNAAKYTHILYRPDYAEILDPKAMDAFYAFIYHRKRTTAYTDEIAEVTNGQVAPFHLRQDYQRGRSRGIEMWASSQRPSMIPTWSMSEAQTMFVFYLKNADDRDRVEEYSGIDRDRIAALEPYQFFVAHQREKIARGPYRLRLTAPTTRPNLRIA